MVRFQGRAGLFVVKRVDKEQKVVDLMHRAGVHEIEENVPLGSIRTLDKDVSTAVQEFLKTTSGREIDGPMQAAK